MSFFDIFYRGLFRHSILCFIGIFLFTLAGVYFLVQLPQDDSIDTVLNKNDEDRIYYNEFKKQFGEESFVVVAFSHNDIFSNEFVRFLNQAAPELEKIPEVEKVTTLSNVEDVLGRDGEIIVRPFVPEDSVSESHFHYMREKIPSSPLVENVLINKNRDVAVFLLKLHESDGTKDSRKRLYESLKASLENINKKFGVSYEYKLAGNPIVEHLLAEHTQKDLKLIMPISGLVLTALLFLFLRNVWSVALTFFCIGSCVIWTLATLQIIGGSMNPFTSCLPAIVMSLVVANAIHIFTDFTNKIPRPREDHRTHLMKILKELWLPCLLTSFTTVGGFLGLTTNEIPVIRHIGYSAAVGLMLEFVLTMTVIPLGIYLFPHKFARKPGGQIFIFRWLQDRLNHMVANIPRWRIGIVVVTLVISGLSILGLFQVKVETNLLDYFDPSTEAYVHNRFVNDELAGIASFEVTLKVDEPEYFLKPEALKKVEELVDHLKGYPIVTQVVSVPLFFKEINRSFHGGRQEYYKVPDEANMVAQYRLIYDGDELYNYVNRDFTWVRVSARTNENSTAKLSRHFDNLQSYLDSHFSQGPVRARITGASYITTRLIDQIVEGQVSGLALGMLPVAIVMFALARSLILGVVALIPNLLPLLFNLGFMGLFGVPLNTATAIITALALGIIVDDTIHFLISYDRARKTGLDSRSACVHAIEDKGVAISSTTMVLVLGFFVLMFSSFVPLYHFGLLTGLLFSYAWICDVVLMPTMLMGNNKREK